MVIALHARVYDAYFLHNYYIENIITQTIILKHSKILYMRIGSGISMRRLDSLIFIHMPILAHQTVS